MLQETHWQGTMATISAPMTWTMMINAIPTVQCGIMEHGGTSPALTQT